MLWIIVEYRLHRTPTMCIVHSCVEAVDHVIVTMIHFQMALVDKRRTVSDYEYKLTGFCTCYGQI